MATSAPPTPNASTAKAPQPKCSPPTMEELCLKRFHLCWFLDRDWLISFMASAQCIKPDFPVTWVEFMPKGHTYLVRSTLKLVPTSKHLPLTKIKEVIFTFLLKTLNSSGSMPRFFNACKAVKPRKRVHKHPGKEVQPREDTMAVSLPSPPTLSLHAVTGPLRPNPLEGGDGTPPLWGRSSKPYCLCSTLATLCRNPQAFPVLQKKNQILLIPRLWPCPTP